MMCTGVLLFKCSDPTANSPPKTAHSSSPLGRMPRDVTEVRSRRSRVWCNQEAWGDSMCAANGRANGDAMTIKFTQHIDLPPVYICPTCFKPTPFHAAERRQVCEEHHFAEVRAVTFVNGEARQASVPVEKPAIKWPEPQTPFQEMPGEARRPTPQLPSGGRLSE